MATSSKEVSVFIPERKLSRVQKRYSKRKTTVRAFTFVKDWQSPVVPTPTVSALVSASKTKKTKTPVAAISSASKKTKTPVAAVSSAAKKSKSKPPVLSNASIVSSSPATAPAAAGSIATDVSKNPLSPASLSRVSPSPRIIASQSPRARIIAASQQKVASPARSSPLSVSPAASQSSLQERAKESLSQDAAAKFRTPKSPPPTQRVSRSQSRPPSSVNSKQSPLSSQSRVSSRSSSRLQSSSSTTKVTSSTKSSQRKGSRNSSRLQENNNSSVTIRNSATKEVDRSRRRDCSKVDVEEEDVEDVLDAGDDVGNEEEDDDDGGDVEMGGGDDEDLEEDHQGAGAEQVHVSSEDEQQQMEDVGDNELENGRTPSVQMALRTLTKTPAEKSMSIIHRTPVSGPVNRVPAKRRRPSPAGKKDAKIAKKPQQKRTVTGSKAKVRLWIGSGRRRTAVDTTDLDVVLAKMEDMAMEYRQDRTSKSEKAAIGHFFQYVEKDLTDKIDLAQEYKTLKSSLSRMNIRTRKQRKQLLELQQRNIRLDMEIAGMKKQQSSTEVQDKALLNISSFLTNLQNLQKNYGTTKPANDKEPGTSSSNLDSLLTEAKVKSQSRQKLRGLNNRLENWLETH